MGYIAPETGIDTHRETSEYTNAIDIWALGCITHEVLTQALPFRGLGELSSYCSCPKLPRDAMLAKNISKRGIEFVERMLAYPPERRITAREALELEWLQPEEKAVVGMGKEDWAGSVLLEKLSPLDGEVANRYSPPGKAELGFRDRVAATMDAKDQQDVGGGLSAPAQGSMIDTFAFSPVFDNCEEELQKLLGDHQALSKEVTKSLIRNLKIPSPSGQTRLAEKEVLFPAHLVNIVTREMLNSGFVRESKRFLANVMQSIRHEVVVSEDTAKMRGPGR